MKDEHELHNLMKTLRPEASLPRLQFETELKKKLLKVNKKYDQSGNTASNFFDFLKFNPKLAGLFSMLILIGLFYSVGNLYISNNQTTLQDSVNTLQASEKYAVLTNIYQNNPQSVLANNFQTGLLTNQVVTKNDINSEGVLNQPAQMAPLAIALAKNFNFYQVTYQRTFGPLASSCPALASDNTTLDSFNYEILDQSNNIVQSYTKIISYNIDNTIRSLHMTDNVGELTYDGGKYAARLSYPDEDLLKNQIDITNAKVNSTTLPTPAPDDIKRIGQMFGTEIKVNKINVDGHELYQVISTNNQTSGNICYDTQERTVYIVNTIDPEQNYQVMSSAYYLDDIKIENLILTSSNLYKRENITPEQALQKYFTLDQSIPIKDFGTMYPNINTFGGVDKEVQAAMSTLESKKITVLLSNALPLKFRFYNDINWNRGNYIQTFAYVWDPDFYTPENWLKREEELKKTFPDISSPVSYDLAANDLGDAPWINVTISNKSIGDSICTNGEATTVTINNVKIPAKKSTEFSQITCFEYNGYLYNLNFFAGTNTDVNKLLNFKALDAAEPKQAKEIEILIKESKERQLIGELEGSPTPTPTPTPTAKQ